MSSSSSTTPAKKNFRKSEDKYIRFCLLVIWSLLILFGFISLIQPGWLVDISLSGKISEASDYKTAGDILLKKGNYNAAAAQYIKAIKIQPDFNDAYGNLGISYTQLKRYDDAIKIFNYLLKNDAKNIYNNYYNLAEIYKQQGNIDAAIECYHKSAETNPHPIYSYQYLGELYLKLQNWEMAIETFKLALANKLTMENSYYGMLKSVELSSQDKPEILNAINLFLKSSIEPGHYDKAIFELALKRDREIAKTHNFLGYAFSMENNFREAEKNYLMALDIWPDFVEAKQNFKDLNNRIKS